MRPVDLSKARVVLEFGLKRWVDEMAPAGFSPSFSVPLQVRESPTSSKQRACPVCQSSAEVDAVPRTGQTALGRNSRSFLRVLAGESPLTRSTSHAASADWEARPLASLVDDQ